MPTQPRTLPSPLRDNSGCLFETVALAETIPAAVPNPVPVGGFPKSEEQWGSVIYECRNQACRNDYDVGGHEHPHFIRAWANCPPMDSVAVDVLEEALEIVDTDDRKSEIDALMPQTRGRYEGLYGSEPNLTITVFADPASNGPAVDTCDTCGERTDRYPVYVWPESMTAPDWWEAALAAYDGPVWSPKGPTEHNPEIERSATVSTDRSTDAEADADLTEFL